MTKLDKAIKEEQERFEKFFEGFPTDSYDAKIVVDSNDIKDFITESNKRIAKAALEASKLEEKSWMKEKIN